MTRPPTPVIVVPWISRSELQRDRGTEVGPHSQCGEKIPVWTVEIEIKIASFAMRAGGSSLIA